MHNVVPFRAWRYAPDAGELTRLAAPPYDVIDQALQSRLYARDQHNVVRVDLGMTTPSDNDCDNQYTRAAALLEEWRRDGTLVRDPSPSMTFVEEGFTGPDGRARTRYGFLAAIRLTGFDQGVVFPHEQTFAGPKEDRYRLLTATAMSLSPVFLLYDLPANEITAAWKAGVGAGPPAGTVTGEGDAVTKLWPTSDPALLNTVGQSLAASRFIIADGHHRYETALRYKENRPEEAAGYALAYFSNMADPGLAIYSTHRLIGGLDPRTITELPTTLSSTFSVERLATPAAPPASEDRPGADRPGLAAQRAIATFLDTHPRWAFGLWGPELDAPYGVRLLDPAVAQRAAPGHSKAYQELDVTILQTLVFERALGLTPADIAEERHVTFFKDPNDAFARLEAGEFQAGFFMNPTRLDQIREVAVGGERMPQKATYFYPKLPTGLVFQDLLGKL